MLQAIQEVRRPIDQVRINGKAVRESHSMVHYADLDYWACHRCGMIGREQARNLAKPCLGECTRAGLQNLERLNKGLLPCNGSNAGKHRHATCTERHSEASGHGSSCGAEEGTRLPPPSTMSTLPRHRRGLALSRGNPVGGGRPMRA